MKLLKTLALVAVSALALAFTNQPAEAFCGMIHWTRAHARPVVVIRPGAVCAARAVVAVTPHRAVWVPAHWQWAGRHRVWVRGHWR
ncbi:MAG: YXWGXW repeat-containing protein [Candidatus Eisenbacteria bacterium]